MLVQAAVATIGDDEIAELLASRAADAHRLATWLLRDPVAAEDAVQEAAMAAWDGRRKLRYSGNLDAWFNRIVVNVCRDELRRRGKRRLLPEAALTASNASSHGPDALAMRDEIERAISRLSADEQVAIGLRYGRDLTVPQIASQTGWAEGTVKSRLHHSLLHLRAELAAERRVGEPER